MHITDACCYTVCVRVLFSLVQDSCQQKEKDQYKELMDTVNWFLFELLVLGYVEDPTSGASFRLPGGLCWAVYIEVREYGILYCVMSYLATSEILLLCMHKHVWYTVAPTCRVHCSTYM